MLEGTSAPRGEYAALPSASPSRASPFHASPSRASRCGATSSALNRRRREEGNPRRRSIGPRAPARQRDLWDALGRACVAKKIKTIKK